MCSEQHNIRGRALAIADGFESESIHKRRVKLFRASLCIMIFVAAAFIPINIYIELYLLAAIEFFFALFGVILFKLVKKPAMFMRCRYWFVGVAAVWAVAASHSSSTSPTIFVWNALFLPYAFFLLGRKKGLIFSMFFIPIVSTLFINSHFPELQVLSLESIANIVIFTICLFAFCLFYEFTRSDIEGELVEDIQMRKRAENKNLVLIAELQTALDEVKKLSGLLPICASCKSVRDDNGYWSQVEVYVEQNSDAEFSHGLCPDCVQDLYPDLDIDLEDLYCDDLPDRA